MRDYKNLILSHGPIGYWPLEGNADDITGITGNGTGAGSGGNITSDQDGMINAETSSYGFNKPATNGRYISTGQTGMPASSDRTFEAWFVFTGSGQKRILYSQHDGGSTRMAIGMLLGSSKIGVWRGNGPNEYLLSSTAIVVDKVYHIVIARRGSTEYLYLDGKLDASAGAQTWAVSPATIGGQNVTTETWQGDISHVAIYDYALTVEQIEEHYLVGKNPNLSDYDHEVHKDFPVAFWKLNDRTGQPAKDEMGNITGTYAGGVSQEQTSLLIVDDNSTSVSFDGTDDYVTFGDVALPPFDGASTLLSVEAWVMTTGNDSTYPLIKYDNTIATRSVTMYAGVLNSGELRMFIGDDTGDNYWYANTTNLVPDNTPTHIVITLDAATKAMTAYINGVLSPIGAPSTGGTPPVVYNNSTTPLEINRLTPSSGVPAFYDGTVQNVSFYDYIISPDRVMAHYIAGVDKLDSYSSRVLADNPVGYWRLGDITGVVAADIGSAGNNGTVAGSPAMEQPGLLINDEDKSILFDNSNDLIDLGSVFDFERTDTFSVECVADVPDAAITRYIMGNVPGGAPYTGWGTMFLTTGQLRLQLINTWSTNALAVTTVSAYDNGAPRHIAFTYDGSSSDSGITVYVDGLPVATTTTYNSLSASIVSSSDTRIGADGGGGNFMAGTLDEVAIYDYVLSSKQVLNHYLSSGVFTNNNYKDVVLASDPKCYFLLNDASGGIFDIIGGSTESMSGSPTYNNNSLLIGDDKGAAIDFTNGPHATRSGTLSFTEMTIEAWVRPDTGSGFRQPIGQDSSDGADPGFAFKLNGGSTIGLQAVDTGGTNRSVGAAKSYTPGDTLHLVGIMTSSYIQLYVDNVLIGTGYATFDLSNFQNGLKIGAGYYNHSTSDLWDGAIQHVSVYDKVLTRQEISNHYIAGKAIL